MSKNVLHSVDFFRTLKEYDREKAFRNKKVLTILHKVSDSDDGNVV